MLCIQSISVPLVAPDTPATAAVENRTSGLSCVSRQASRGLRHALRSPEPVVP